MKVLNMDVAGFKLAQLALALYNRRNGKREQHFLSDKLADAAIEAGRLVADVQTFARNRRAAVSERALDGVNKLVFIVYLMKNEGVYSEYEIDPVISLAQEIKTQLIMYIEGGLPKNVPVRSGRNDPDDDLDGDFDD